MDEIRLFGYCPVCSNEVTSEDDVYVNEDGEYFDCVECVMERYHVVKIEC